MDLRAFQKKSIETKNLYEQLEKKVSGKSWTRGELSRALMADIGAAMKLMMAEDGLRIIEGSKEKLTHEVGDIIWAVLVLCEKYDIDAEEALAKTLEELDQRIKKQMAGELETSFSQH